MENTPSTPSPANHEAPKGLNYRTAILIVLAGAALLAKDDRKSDEIGKSAKNSQKDDFCKQLDSAIQEEQVKDEKSKILDSNSLILSDRLREKMKPLKSVIPPNVIQALSQYDPEKARMLDSVMVVLDDRLDIGVQGKYAGRIKIGRNGRVLFDSHGKYHLVLLDSEMFEKDPENPNLFNNTKKNNTELQIALTLVHEIYGHAYDHVDKFTELPIGFEEPLQDDKNKLAQAQSALEDLLEDEFAAFYEEYSFLDWNLQTYSSLCKDYYKDNWIKLQKTWEGGDLSFKEESEYYFAEIISGDFPLYDEYKKGRESRDWTEFKRIIAASYIISNEHLRYFLQYCESRFRYMYEKYRTYEEAEPDVVQKKDKLCGLEDGLVKALGLMEMREKTVKMCMKQNLGNFSPHNPNKKIRNSNRKK